MNTLSDLKNLNERLTNHYNNHGFTLRGFDFLWSLRLEIVELEYGKKEQ